MGIVLIVVAMVAMLGAGILIGRRSETHLRDRILDRADRELAALGALDRIHASH